MHDARCTCDIAGHYSAEDDRPGPGVEPVSPFCNIGAVAALVLTIQRSGYQLAPLLFLSLKQIGGPVCRLDQRIEFTPLPGKFIPLAPQGCDIDSGELTNL